MNILKIFQIAGITGCVLGLGIAAIRGQAGELAQPISVVTAEMAMSIEQLYEQANQAVQKGDDDRALALLTQKLYKN